MLRRFNPFGKLWQAGQRLTDQPCYSWLRQPFRQAVNRLAHPGEIGAAFLLDVFRVHDLQHIAEAVELARDPALFAHGQLLFRCVRRPPEIGDVADIADAILRKDPIGPSVIPRCTVFGRR